MTTHAHRVKVTIDVSEKERKYIKLLAVENNMTISEFVMSFVRPHIPQQQHKQPNAKTRKAMRDIDKRRNLTRCDSLEEFWESVGIDPDA